MTMEGYLAAVLAQTLHELESRAASPSLSAEVQALRSEVRFNSYKDSSTSFLPRTSFKSLAPRGPPSV